MRRIQIARGRHLFRLVLIAVIIAVAAKKLGLAG